jgi:SAM-dependent methyltransferase
VTSSGWPAFQATAARVFIVVFRLCVSGRVYSRTFPLARLLAPHALRHRMRHGSRASSRMSDLHSIAAEGFGRDAHIYARGRPGFPTDSLGWLEQDLKVGPGKTVLELGAGTGKFTELLSRTRADIVAIDPMPVMLQQLPLELPGVRALRGSAQSLPIASAIADAVICAQSFHWFATESTLAEIRRVLKPGGRLGLIWNVRDKSVAWVDSLAELVDRHEGNAPRYDNGEWQMVFPAPGFGPLHQKFVAHEHTGSAEQVIVERTASIGFVAALPADERLRLLGRVRALVASTPVLAGNAAVVMPYVTRMYWCHKEPNQLDAGADLYL